MTFAIPPTGLDPWDAAADNALNFLHDAHTGEVTRAQAAEQTLDGRITAMSLNSKEFVKTGSAVSGVGLIRWYAPVNLTVVAVIVSAGVAPIGRAMTFDLKKNGLTVFPSTKPTIGDSQNVGVLDLATPVALTARVDYLTADIIQVGLSQLGAEINLQALYRIT